MGGYDWRNEEKIVGSRRDSTMNPSSAPAILSLASIQLNITALRDIVTEAANVLSRHDFTAHKGTINNRTAEQFGTEFISSLRSVAGLGAFIPALTGAANGQTLDEALLALGDIDGDMHAIKRDFTIIYDILTSAPQKIGTPPVPMSLMTAIRLLGPILYVLKNPRIEPEHIGRVARTIANHYLKHLETSFDGGSHIINVDGNTSVQNTGDVTKRIDFTRT
jgi:hypothetical protein